MQINCFLLLAVFFTLLISTKATCPCSSEDQCKPVTKHYEKELVAFACGSNLTSWKNYDWSQITHVIMCGDLSKRFDLYCFAHSRNVRVTSLQGISNLLFPKLLDASFRKNLVNQWLNETVTFHLDGINLDIEGSAFTDDIKAAITQLTKEVYETFKGVDENYIVTWDIPYSPYIIGCVTAYCFDYVGISKYVDYMIVMDYDANIDIFVAQANSPLFLVEEGYNFYIKNLSIDPNSLVMALPWYGYDFTCENFLNRTGHELCVIMGSSHLEMSFAKVIDLFYSGNYQLKFNEFSKSVFFSLIKDDIYHQIWFDNSETLAYKYDLAIRLGLRGFSMWHADSLDYKSSDPRIKNETMNHWTDVSNALIRLKSIS